MLETKYYKDLSHNYLILKSSIDTECDKYQNKMLTGNKIENLLSCNIRHINNEVFFYYEISSLQNLENLYKKGKMSYKQLFNLFEYLYEASKQVKEYLLSDNFILLVPEYIFANPEGDKYFFVYFPYAGEDISMLAFSEFLLEKADSEDEKAVEIVYRIYELIQDGNFILPEVLHLFDEMHIKEKEERPDTDFQKYPENNISSEPDMNRTEMKYWDTGQAYQVEKEIWEDETERFEDNYNERSGNQIISAVFLFLCIAAIVIIFCIRYFCLLSVEEELLTIAAIVILVLAASVLFLYLLTFSVRMKTRNNKNNRDEEKTEHPEQRELYMQPVDMYTKIQALDKKSGSKGMIPASAKEKKREETYGDTVFLEAPLFERENKLYGVSKGNKYHIDLDKIPCTIGKMSGGVDIAIKDSSISRIHACFSKEGEEVYVTDLNSTNGTYKNGLRLEPNETIAIEPGDEIRFGKLTFCYR